MKPSISITLPQFERESGLLLRGALMAEDLGFSGIFVFDHLVPVGDVHRPVLESAASLGAIAATTHHIRVGTLVMRAGLRGPDITAMVAATLQAIAPGRGVLGLGAGDRLSAEEAIRYGMDRPGVARRLAQLEETVAKVRDLAPELPVWLGGRHPELRNMAGRIADGWNAWDAEEEMFKVELAEVRRAATNSVTITWGGPVRLGERAPEEIAERLRGLVAAGAEQLVLSLLPNRPPTWELFAEKVMPLLQGT